MANINITGFKNIHFAPKKTDGSYETPVAIKGAKNCEITLNYEQTNFYCDDAIGYQDNYFTGGEVKVTVSGLTPDEYHLLFGNTAVGGGVSVNANDLAQSGALLFEKKILGVAGAVRRFVIYDCIMSPAGISAETLADSVSESNVEINGVCKQLEDGTIYAMIDTNAADYNPAHDAWYEEVQFLEAKPTVLKATK